MARFPAAAPAVAAIALAVAACAKAGSDPTTLQPQDLAASPAPFDASEIVDSASLQDALALDATQIDAFLARTPYGRASFLASYASNGATAAQAIARAAERWQISPLVFLVRAQMDGGLVGEQFYPQPPSRVEFAFGCGCNAPGSCDTRYGGFDMQVDCLGEALRADLDAIAASGTTSGGWGPKVASTTIDGVTVTPSDDSTAALYAYTPAVYKGKAGGNWLFWNVWQLYAQATEYAGPLGSQRPRAWIGDACSGDSQCNYGSSQGTCATSFPGGVCTLACTKSCPSSPTEAQTFCADFGSEGGFCLAVCNPNDPACRQGYSCKSVKQFGNANSSQNVCTK